MSSTAAISERTISKLKQKLSGVDVLTPDSPQYPESIKRWSESCEKKAASHGCSPPSHRVPLLMFQQAAVVLVRNEVDVSNTVKFVKEHGIPFAVRGGGHSTSGSSAIENGIVIDLSRMRDVTVDTAQKTIAAQGGTLWSDVDHVAGKHGLATVGGTVNHTGVGGLTLGGGYGWLTGRYGLTIDLLRSVRIVLADGRCVTASETENPDLFWAVRGAGHNFGVVTEFVFQGFDQKTPVFAASLVYDPDRLSDVVEFANGLHKTTDGDQGLFFGYTGGPPLNRPVVIATCFHNGTEEEGRKIFEKLFDLNPMHEHVEVFPYQKMNAFMNDQMGYEGRKIFGGGGVAMPMRASAVKEVFHYFCEKIEADPKISHTGVLYEIVPYKNVLKVPMSAMSFANRGEYYNVSTMVRWYDAELDGKLLELSRELSSKACAVGEPKKGLALYSNYINYKANPEEIYGENTERLAQLKDKYDPDDLFQAWHRVSKKGNGVQNGRM